MPWQPRRGAPRNRRHRIAMLRLQSLIPSCLFVPLALVGANSLAQVPEGSPTRGEELAEQDPDSPTPDSPTPGDPAQGDPEDAPSVQDPVLLETRLAGIELQLAKMSEQLEALTLGQQEIRVYLDQRAVASRALDAAIDRAVQQGYTAGINFESRETLVAAWRKELEAIRTNVPMPAPIVEPPATTSRR